MAQEHLDGIIEFMLMRGMLYEDGGMLSMGVEGERTFGRRHFMDLMSVCSGVSSLQSRQASATVSLATVCSTRRTRIRSRKRVS